VVTVVGLIGLTISMFASTSEVAHAADAVSAAAGSSVADHQMLAEIIRVARDHDVPWQVLVALVQTQTAAARTVPTDQGTALFETATTFPVVSPALSTTVDGATYVGPFLIRLDQWGVPDPNAPAPTLTLAAIADGANIAQNGATVAQDGATVGAVTVDGGSVDAYAPATRAAPALAGTDATTSPPAQSTLDVAAANDVYRSTSWVAERLATFAKAQPGYSPTMPFTAPAQAAVWHAAIEQLPVWHIADAGPLTSPIVVYGDSIQVGAQAAGAFPGATFHARVGETFAQGVAEFDAARPPPTARVVVALGTNGFGVSMSTPAQMVDDFIANTPAGQLTIIEPREFRRGSPVTTVDAVIAAAVAARPERDVHVIDATSAELTTNQISSDNVHPTPSGYKILAEWETSTVAAEVAVPTGQIVMALADGLAGGVITSDSTVPEPTPGLSSIQLDADAAAVSSPANTCGLDWPLIAAIAHTEVPDPDLAGSGTSKQPSIGAPSLTANTLSDADQTFFHEPLAGFATEAPLGPLQLLPSEWLAIEPQITAHDGVRPDPQNLYDATIAAVLQLCSLTSRAPASSIEISPLVTHFDRMLDPAAVVAADDAYRSSLLDLATRLDTAHSLSIASMLRWADSMLGTPYAAVSPYRFGEVLWDGETHTADSGSVSSYTYPAGTRVFDCSGFVSEAYKLIGVTIPTSSDAIATSTLMDVDPTDLQPGDVIVYQPIGGIGHVALFVSGTTQIESTPSGVHYSTVIPARIEAIKRPLATLTPTNAPLVAYLDGGPTAITLPSGLVLDSEKLSNAAVVIQTGNLMKIDATGIVAALMAAMTESNLHNYQTTDFAPYTSRVQDHDSLGIFQMRPSTGWGTVAQVTDVIYEATTWFQHLQNIPNWMTLPLGPLDQLIEQSAFPLRYAGHETDARALYSALLPLVVPGAVVFLPAPPPVAVPPVAPATPPDSDPGTIPAEPAVPGSTSTVPPTTTVPAAATDPAPAPTGPALQVPSDPTVPIVDTTTTVSIANQPMPPATSTSTSSAAPTVPTTQTPATTLTVPPSTVPASSPPPTTTTVAPVPSTPASSTTTVPPTGHATNP
jgi:cell wall-associated NlpC family hydrolase